MAKNEECIVSYCTEPAVRGKFCASHGCGHGWDSQDLCTCYKSGLRAENARLQERVEQLEEQVRMAAPSAVAWKEKADRLTRDIAQGIVERDGYKAQVEGAIKRGVMLWQQFVWLLWAVDRECAAAEQAQTERDGYKAQVEGAEIKLGFFESAGFPTPQDILEKIDGYEALAKVRGDALEPLARLAEDSPPDTPADHCLYDGCFVGLYYGEARRARAAINLTPEEAKAQCNESE